MKKICTLLIIFTFFTTLVNATSYNVLFLGNSYTAYNDLPGTVRNIALSNGDTINIQSNTPGSQTLSQMFNNITAKNLIDLGNWDYVIVQAQSQEPSFSPSQVASNTLPYAKSLDSLIKLKNPCAEVMYYMTWGRKNGDAGNCANYPVICTYAGMQGRLRESYLLMAQDNNSSVAPVGVVWAQVRQTDASIELYNPDESHPSVAGTYLAACTFYSSIFHKKVTNSSFVSTGVNTTAANTIRNVSNTIVLDSIENWQQYGKIPFADFKVATSGNAATITNLAKRFNSITYNLGDGNTSNSTNATIMHNYATAGGFNILQTVSNTCNKKDTATQVINSTLSVKELLANNGITVISNLNQIVINNTHSKALELELFNTNGQIITLETSNQQHIKLEVDGYSKGVYILKIRSGKELWSMVVHN
jgi:hypothetical protein